jgi:hypothetical protein
MRTLLLSLTIALIPFASLGAGLNCQEDPNSSTPYKKMRDAQINRTKNDYQKLVEKGVNVMYRDKMINSIMDDYVELCQEKKTFDSVVASFQATANDNNLTDGSGAAAKIAEPAKTMSEANEKFVNSLRGSYKRQTANFEEYVNRDRIEANAKGSLDDTWVKDSFRKAWGFAPKDRPNQSTKKTAQFPSLIREIGEELESVKKRNGELTTLAQKVEALKKNVDTIGDKNLKAGAQPTNNKVDGKDNESSALKELDNSNENGEKTQPYVNETETNTPENLGPVKEKGGGIGEWVSHNKGTLLLGAGAAAVVGGVLWYKHEQDKKQDKWNDWADGQVNSASATITATTTATSTSTGSDTVTSGSNFTLNVSGFPQGAVKGKTLGMITVSVIGPSGQPASESGIQVSIACVGSCSLTGTLTKTAANGRAEFNDLSFTAAETGVQLRVSSPSLNSVASPGSFDVTEETNRE